MSTGGFRETRPEVSKEKGRPHACDSSTVRARRIVPGDRELHRPHARWLGGDFPAPADGTMPTFDELRDHIASRLCRAPRYRQRLSGVPLGPRLARMGRRRELRHRRPRAPQHLARRSRAGRHGVLRAAQPAAAAVGAVDSRRARRRPDRRRGQGPPLPGRRHRRGRAGRAAARPEPRSRRSRPASRGLRAPRRARFPASPGACATAWPDRPGCSLAPPRRCAAEEAAGLRRRRAPRGERAGRIARSGAARASAERADLASAAAWRCSRARSRT